MSRVASSEADFASVAIVPAVHFLHSKDYVENFHSSLNQVETEQLAVITCSYEEGILILLIIRISKLGGFGCQLLFGQNPWHDDESEP